MQWALALGNSPASQICGSDRGAPAYAPPSFHHLDGQAALAAAVAHISGKDEGCCSDRDLYPKRSYGGWPSHNQAVRGAIL